MKILIFTEGTLLMHENAVWHSREEIVQQVKNKDPSVKNYSTYVPIGRCIDKLRAWKEKGATIIYLTSRKSPEEIEAIQNLLTFYEFPEGKLEFRKKLSGLMGLFNEEYKDVVERIMPDILIEDDCESIGGEKQMCYTNVKEELKSKIKSIVVKEFEGIDNLPDELKS
ncbi:hypothetical protein HY837_02960 [archaeon]|nr:hypothetical protein [archaeon]